MRTCTNCSREISDTAKVCGFCGTPLHHPPRPEPVRSEAPLPAQAGLDPSPPREVAGPAMPVRRADTRPGPKRIAWAGLAGLVGAIAAAVSVQTTWLLAGRLTMWDLGTSIWDCARDSAASCSYWEIFYSTGPVSGGVFNLAAIWLTAGAAGTLAIILMTRRGRPSGGRLSAMVAIVAIALPVVGVWDAVQFHRIEIELFGVSGYRPGPMILAAGMLVSALGLALARAWSRGGTAA